ncbi:leukotriene A-4 hydrolase, variant 2 [Cymbomonas tetramitiformis]|uniref:Leucine aminopeptidase n=1 Tax=Cymbomonas tetramitiformis TaxID=36881 RepID=A0AAE0G3I8_9CHLO|nr:leukotriene A-4 hydrolase, variant 2 [Cymbomonas tetramitiformis]
MPGTSTNDPCSQANPEEALVTNVDIEFFIDFEAKVISSFTALTVKVLSEETANLVLDTRDLDVHACVLVSGSSEEKLEYAVGEKHEALGSSLTISLPGVHKGDEIIVGVHSTTSPSCTAVQFLEPQQTAGGTHPYLFSQCQAIHARSLIPCQDTPGAKMTYAATVWVPSDLTALMSAVPSDTDVRGTQSLRFKERATGTHKAFHFLQKISIPPYLLALAAGLLEARDIGPRSRVWSEPTMVESGAYEFADTEKFLSTGEAIAGEYVWGRYDILLLPPSFPYGGMENPCLTFVTPTLLAGDRSQANVVAHEIAHSWCGNLVTNNTWEHFWLNEGFTVFLERKILGRLHGDPMFHFHALGGLKALADSVKDFGATHPFTALVPDLSGGKDPDDAFSRVPYEKGFNFLYYLQTTVGGAEKFEPFFREHIQRYANSTVDSLQFKAFFIEYFKGTKGIEAIDWDAWLYGPGMPPVENQFDGSLMQQADALASTWHLGDVMGIGGGNFEGCSAQDIEGWEGEQVVAFLEKLLELRSMTALHPTTVRRMDDLYKFSASRNSEIRHAWFRLNIKAGCEEVIPHVTKFLVEQGRMKYIRPLYRALFNSQMGRKTALDTFTKHQGIYHPIAQKMVAQDLGLISK